LGALRVELRSVYVAYQDIERPALKNASLFVGENRVVVITGPNGAGKTTLLETCLGLLKPFKGVAKLLGVLTTSRKLHDVRKLCSYLPQNFMRGPYESYTAKQVIAMGLLSLRNTPSTLTASDVNKIRSIAKLLNIESLLNEPIGKLSGGQQQRVFLARALVREPLVLFLDEPFSSIDPEGRRSVVELLNSYTRERNATTLIVSHIVDSELMRIANAVVFMSNGEVVRIEGAPH
jgi:ABC-type multidrug transport system ATPase subunit